MKRIVLLLLVLVLLLAACGEKKPAKTEKPVDKDPITNTDTENNDKTDPAPETVYRNPLNGEKVESAWVGRPTAVVINNIKAALPHYGTSDADFLYELETESGITRMLAVYSDITTVGQVGPIRSSRTFFNSIARSYDAPIVHCGGSVRGRHAGYEDSGNTIADWAHLDATSYENSYFFRDYDRYNNQGYNWEHTLFSKGEDLLRGLEAREVAQPTDRSTDFGLQFAEDASLSGAAANKVVVEFKDGKTTSFAYDADAKLYKTSQYGSEYTDVNNGEVVSFRNVIVLYTSQWYRHDGEYSRSYYELFGEGEGLLAIDGKIVNIKWSREGLDSPFVYTLADGTAVTLGTGHTYVGVTSGEATYE